MASETTNIATRRRMLLLTATASQSPLLIAGRVANSQAT